MTLQNKLGSSVLLATLVLLGHVPAAHAYGPEGLFGGRPQPDSTITLANPVELKNDRPERAESVLEHPRPDYDAAPIEIGSFELFPTLELSETYDSNIYATPNKERDDMIGTIRPIVNLFSNWGRHALSVTTFGDINYYSEHANENYQNGVFDVNGRYDIMSQTWVAGRAGFQRLAEPRSSPDAINGTQPATFNMAKGGVGFFRGLGKLKLTADYDYKRFDYDSVPSSNGPISQSNRNRDEHKMASRLSYDWSGNLKPYIRGEYNIRTYDHNPRQESDGFLTVAGATADFGGITSVDLYGGYMAQYYDKSLTAKRVESPTFGGRLDWNVTGKTSLVLEGSRSIEETTLTNHDSYYSTGGSATLTHELLRNVILEANFGFTEYDFNGTGSRTDDVYAAGLGGRYLINRNLYTDLLYSYDQRESTDNTADYSRNQVTLRLGVRM